MTKQLKKRSIKLALSAVLISLMMAMSLVTPVSAGGTVRCFNTTQRSSTYSSFGLDLFRHESKGSWCRDNHNITSVSPRRNEIVKIGVGNGYFESEWDRKGATPAWNTWNDHYGRAGLTISIPWIGSIGISRTHRFDYEFWKTAVGNCCSSWSRSSSSWYL